MRLMKRSLAILLMLVFILALIPATSLGIEADAAGDNANSESNYDEWVYTPVVTDRQTASDDSSIVNSIEVTVKATDKKLANR